MLKTFQRLGYFPHPEHIPNSVLNHIRSCLKLKPKVNAIPPERSRRRYEETIRAYLGVSPYNKQAQRVAAQAIATMAEIQDHPADLVNVAIEELVKERYELPAFSTLDRLVSKVRTAVNNRLFEKVASQMSPVEIAYLDGLLGDEPPLMSSEGYAATLSDLKAIPKNATISHIRELQTKFDRLMSFGDAQSLVKNITPTKVKYFAALAKAMDISELRAVKLPKRRTLLLCLLYTAEKLEAAIRRLLPERSLLEILCNVEHWLNWTRHFGPLSGLEGKLVEAQERYLLTIFGYGCNLGPNQTARHTRGRGSRYGLSYINRRHLTTSMLEAATRDIINSYNRFNLPKFWGTGKRASADGTKFDIYQNNLVAEYHIRYGGYGGIVYSHVSDTYIALFSHFITCGVWEAVYILDGLLKNRSDIQPDILHADTQGQSTPVLALAYLLGIELMPRIRNWKDLTFFRPHKEATYSYIEPLFGGIVDWKLIETHWQDLMRVVLSIRAGKIMPSILLRKLGTYSRKNRLYQAFRELGRAVRTIFLLQYISDRGLRRIITASTNQVEAFQGFLDWVFFGKDGVITENDPEEQEKRVKYLHLVANAVILQNAVDISHAIQSLVAQGHLVNREMISTLSPYITGHIKRYGDYVVDLTQIPQPLETAIELPVD